MTNKEAIEILTQTQINLGRRNGKKAFTEALSKAIAALEKRPQGEINNNKRHKPKVISPEPSPYRYVTKVLCPRCNDLLLVYDGKDPIRLPMPEGEPLDNYNFCRKCGLCLDMSDFKFRYVVTHGGNNAILQ